MYSGSVIDVATFLDEFRPFRRGELALARKSVEEPFFMNPRDLDRLRYALRLAQLTTIGGGRDSLVFHIGTFRLRLLQLLAPVLPTNQEEIDGRELHGLLPTVEALVGEARTQIIENQLASEERLDAEIANKRLALVLGGAAGSGYIFLGALQRLQDLEIEPAYMVGCSLGAILAVIRGRTRDYDVEEIYREIGRIRLNGVFRAPDPNTRFGLPAALRLDLKAALGELFATPDGDQLTLGELAIPVDTLATGLGPGALGRPRAEFAEVLGKDLRDASELSRIRGRVLARVVSALVSMAMSRQVLVPIFFGSTPETRQLPALDAAAFSAAIPAVLQHDIDPADRSSTAILEALFERHELVGVVDGALSSMVPARYAWQAIEAGRIDTTNTCILALDALSEPSRSNALLAPLLRTISSTSHRDKPFWDLHVAFRKAPPLLEVFPIERRLRLVSERGEREFEPTARLLRSLLAPLPGWKELRD
ncbi:MAG: hypothetical protein GY725_14435 [bacterium]|nr:hypothetical protein [bacterium]